jgi:uncharacterized membrane protein
MNKTATFKTIDLPGATSTMAFGVNNFGQVVGDYTVGISQAGFLDTNGSFSTINFPGTPFGSTEVRGINDLGQIVGSYFNTTGTHGFVDTNGTFKPIDEPASKNSTRAFGINDRGQAVGLYYDGTTNPWISGQQWQFHHD